MSIVLPSHSAAAGPKATGPVVFCLENHPTIPTKAGTRPGFGAAIGPLRILTEATRVARTAAPGADLAITTEVRFELIPVALIERSTVTHHAHCPVAVIHGMSAIDAVSATPPVLVGVDGSANSVPAVEIAFE